MARQKKNKEFNKGFAIDSVTLLQYYISSRYKKNIFTFKQKIVHHHHSPANSH